MADPLALDAAVDHVLECMCAALTELHETDPTFPGCPCLACKVPGAPQLCCPPAGPNGAECAGGQLTVRPVRLFPSTTFPGQDTGTPDITCAPYTLVAELSVVLVRCHAQVSDDDEENLPTCDQLAAEARILNLDMLAIQRAALCCVPAATPGRKKRWRTVVASHIVLPPTTCYGSELRLLVDLGACACDEDLPTPDPSA